MARGLGGLKRNGAFVLIIVALLALGGLFAWGIVTKQHDTEEEPPPFVEPAAAAAGAAGAAGEQALPQRLDELAAEMQQLKARAEQLLKHRAAMQQQTAQGLQSAGQRLQQLEQQQQDMAAISAGQNSQVQVQVQPQSHKAKAAANGSKRKLPRFREDGRCGPNFPAPGAPAFGECDPTADADQRGPCCNPESGYCGNLRQVHWGHCDCVGCVDYSQPNAGAGQNNNPALLTSKCDKAFSFNTAGWRSEVKVCAPLFSKADLSKHQHTKIECRDNPTLGATICTANNVHVGFTDAESGLPALSGSCLLGLTSEQVRDTISHPAQRFLRPLAEQKDLNTDLQKECQSWITTPTLMVEPSGNSHADLFAAFQALSVAGASPASSQIILLPSLQPAIKPWEELFSSVLKSTDLKRGTCFESLIIGYSGLLYVVAMGSPLASVKLHDDCTELGLAPCRQAAEWAEGFLELSCPEAAG